MNHSKSDKSNCEKESSKLLIFVQMKQFLLSFSSNRKKLSKSASFRLKVPSFNKLGLITSMWQNCPPNKGYLPLVVILYIDISV